MGNIITIIVTVLPLLRDYFTKNKGLNTVSGGVFGAFGVILVQALEQNTASVDQLITYVSNQGTYGIYAAAVVVALRTGVYFLAASKKA